MRKRSEGDCWRVEGPRAGELLDQRVRTQSNVIIGPKFLTSAKAAFVTVTENTTLRFPASMLYPVVT